jgi:hypothetical protein
MQVQYRFGGGYKEKTMDKQKKIEEMAEDISKHLHGVFKMEIDILAESLYNACYRKIPENAVVLTGQELDLFCNIAGIISPSSGKTVGQAIVDKIRKETVEKIADWLDNEKGYCGLGYLVKRQFGVEGKQ